MPDSKAIAVNDLTKKFEQTHALAGVSFEVERGEILGYLGRNGSGKTTTVRILSTLTAATGGDASVMGFDVVDGALEVRSRIGVTLQEAALDEVMTGSQHLILVSRLWGMDEPSAEERSSELLELFGLTTAADQQISAYSGGMKRRLDIATALLNHPEVLFLDEPTTGLDPQSRRALWSEIRALRESGTTVFLTTQYLEEADELADRVIVLDNGQILAEGTAQSLKVAHGHSTVALRLGTRDDMALLIKSVPQFELQASDADLTASVLIPPGQGAGGVIDLIASVRDSGIAPVGMSVTEPSLEEVFIELTGSSVSVDSGTSQLAADAP